MSDFEENGVVHDENALRGIMGETMEIAIEKCRDKLDRHCRVFIARSPLLCIGTSDARAKADVSARGEHPGFVQIPDNKRIFICDRPENNRLDTMTNIVENPNVGLLLILGYDDTLGVNEHARISRNKGLTGAFNQRLRSQGGDRGRGTRGVFCIAPRRSSARAGGIRKISRTEKRCRRWPK